jgi:sugar lactone lactonase YvrE
MKNLSVASSFLAAFFLSIGPLDLHANPGDLYSGQLNGNEVDKFTPAGGAPTLFVSGFFADALAFDVRGNLFVADVSDQKIKKVTPGGVTTDFATIGNPMGLAFDRSGNLFISDASTESIIKLTPTGGNSPLPPGFSGLNGPFGLAFDRNGNLFVSEANTGTISKITPTGTKTPFASGLSSPEGLAFDSAGNLYEVDFGSGNVFKFTPGGVKSTFTSGLLGPRNIAIDKSDNVFVANFTTQEILKFTPTAPPTRTTFASNTNSGGLAFEPATAQLINISTRASVQTGSSVTIAGFIITGTDSKSVVIRGLGPTLAQPPFNVPGVLGDPFLSLRDANNNPIWNNNNWRDSQQTQIQNLGPACAGHTCAPPNDLESAILSPPLPPGNYTAILSGNNNTTGVGLVEVYDVSTGAFAQLTNVSTRGFVGINQNVMIGGFITSGGNGSTEVLVRGLGPTLGQPPFNVPGALADPFLQLFDGNGTLLYSNNDWKDSQQAQIQATGLAPPNDLESAIRRTVAPGNYTAVLSGKGGGTGIGLVEVYKLR